MKKITLEQIQAILQAVYQTNMSAKDFDALKSFFEKLPPIEEEKTADK